MTLALPVTHPRVPSQILLKAHFVLNDTAINRLKELGVSSIWLHYPSLGFLEKVINMQVLKAQGQVVTDITQTFELIQNQSTAKLPYEQYTQSIGELINQLVSNPQAALFMGDLTSSESADKDLMRHSSAVTYLSLLMGMKLEGYLIKQRKHVDPSQAKEVVELGIGAMLHDIGTTMLDKKVRDDFTRTGQETDAWRQHVVEGYQTVRGKISASAATVVLNHHQRFDGSGYGAPDSPPQQGERMHIFSRIVSIADYFDTCRFPQHGEAVPTIIVLKHLLEPDTLKLFDLQVVRALLTIAPPFPPGSLLKLKDGRFAAAIDHNPANPCRPKVQIISDPGVPGAENEPPGETIDLADKDTDPKLAIHMLDDQDVSKHLFPAPAMMGESLSRSFM